MLAPPRPSWLLPLLFVLPIACSSAVDYELGDGGVDSGPEIVDTSDQDGMDDNWEREHGLDPNADDSGSDLDGDGLTNKQEHDLGTLPNDIDSDDDGLTDGAEVEGGQTDPLKADTDGDGLQDGLEEGRAAGVSTKRPGVSGTDTTVFTPDQDPSTRSNAAKADSDGDGIPDGVEDANQNGRVDPGETNPMSVDSDNDGVADGEEDANHNGVQDPGETSASNADSDGDGISDGVELGKTSGVADPDGDGPITGTDSSFVPDADGSTKTKPLNDDSDGDGVKDGDEDLNQNGRVDDGELDPNKPRSGGEDGLADGVSGNALVCTDANLPKLTLYRLLNANLTLALPSDREGDNANLNVSEIVSLKEPNAAASVGLMFRDAGGRVGFVVTTATQNAAAVREKIDGVTALSSEQNRALTTWDGFSARLSATNALASSAHNAKDMAMEIAQAVTGLSNLGDGLPAAGDPGRYFELHYEVIQRSDTQTVVAVALRHTTAAVSYNTDETPKLIDMVNTSVGRFGDGLGLRCDPITAEGNDVIDILWVVDNSNSMREEQAKVSQAANAMVSFLNTTSVSWRLALTSMRSDEVEPLHPEATSQDQVSETAGPFYGQMQDGFTAVRDPGTWAASVVGLGLHGGGSERGLASGLRALNATDTGADASHRLRDGASVLVVHMTDEEDFDVNSAAATGGPTTWDYVDSHCPENAQKTARITQFAEGYANFLSTHSAIDGLTTFAITGVEPRPDWTGTNYDDNGVYNPCGAYAGSRDCPSSAQYARGYIDVATALGGGASSICGDMTETVREIMRAGAGIASSFELSQQPVSSSLRVVLSDSNGRFLDDSGNEVFTEVARSRTEGFDYAFEVDATGALKHKVVFYSTAFSSGTVVMIGYRTWKEAERDAAGEVPCDCPEGQVCHPDNGECEVDPTCGSACEADACNQDTGLCEDPCGGQCVDSQTCQPNGTCTDDNPCGCTGGAYCDTRPDPPVCVGGDE